MDVIPGTRVMLVVGRLEAKLLKHTDDKIQKLIFLSHQGLGWPLCHRVMHEASMVGKLSHSLHVVSISASMTTPCLSSKVAHPTNVSVQTTERNRSIENENIHVLQDPKWKMCTFLLQSIGQRLLTC